MTYKPVKCPRCGSGAIKRFGTAHNGKQRYLCCNTECSRKTFVENYTYLACGPSVRSRIFFSTVNGGGIRAAAGTLGIAQNTVINALKSIEPRLWYVHMEYLAGHRDNSLRVSIAPVEEAEMDEMRSFAGDISHQYRLWRAIDHTAGEPPAFHFGGREHKNLDELLKLLEGFDIETVYADNNYAYSSRITNSEVIIGKTNTQKIERGHLSLRTWCSRLIRKGIRFSKSFQMHKIVIALIINFWFFGRSFW